MWPFSKKKTGGMVIINVPEQKPPEKMKAPDLSPAVAPKGHVFYVEPIKRWRQATPHDPSEYSVRVYLFTENQAANVSAPGERKFWKDYGYPCVGCFHTHWIDKDPEETKKWINSTMHELLKAKRKSDEENANLETLTGFYPPKEM